MNKDYSRSFWDDVEIPEIKKSDFLKIKKKKKKIKKAKKRGKNKKIKKLKKEIKKLNRKINKALEYNIAQEKPLHFDLNNAISVLAPRLLDYFIERSRNNNQCLPYNSSDERFFTTEKK